MTQEASEISYTPEDAALLILEGVGNRRTVQFESLGLAVTLRPLTDAEAQRVEASNVGIARAILGKDYATLQARIASGEVDRDAVAAEVKERLLNGGGGLEQVVQLGQDRMYCAVALAVARIEGPSGRVDFAPEKPCSERVVRALPPRVPAALYYYVQKDNGLALNAAEHRSLLEAVRSFRLEPAGPSTPSPPLGGVQDGAEPPVPR